MNYLIVLLVNSMHHYLAVLEAWEKAGFAAVAIHALTGLEHAEYSTLRDDLPMIPSLRHFLAGNKKAYQVLLATTDSQEVVGKMVSEIQKVLDNPKYSGEGTLFVVPLLQALHWSKKERENP